MTTLDELIVAGVERGLREPEVLRLVLSYREGETAAQALARLLPPEYEQMAIAQDLCEEPAP